MDGSFVLIVDGEDADGLTSERMRGWPAVEYLERLQRDLMASLRTEAVEVREIQDLNPR